MSATTTENLVSVPHDLMRRIVVEALFVDWALMRFIDSESRLTGDLRQLAYEVGVASGVADEFDENLNAGPLWEGLESEARLAVDQWFAPDAV